MTSSNSGQGSISGSSPSSEGSGSLPGASSYSQPGSTTGSEPGSGSGSMGSVSTGSGSMGSSSQSGGSSSNTPPEDWKVWPGGQTDEALNPIEVFKNSDFGFTGPVSWNVTNGAVNATVFYSDETSIKVRYNQASQTAAKNQTVEIQASSWGTTNSKFRTVFKVSWTIRTNGLLNPLNNIEFQLYTGYARRTLELNHPGQRGATGFAAKQEATLSFQPLNIPWSQRGVNFVDDGNGFMVPDRLKIGRMKLAASAIALGSPNINSPKGRRYRNDNDFGWNFDSSRNGVWHAQKLDGQYQSDAHPNFAFRIDNPGDFPRSPPRSQFYVRSNFREVALWDGKEITGLNMGTWHVIFNHIDEFVFEPASSHGPGHTNSAIPNFPPNIRVTAIVGTKKQRLVNSNNRTIKVQQGQEVRLEALDPGYPTADTPHNDKFAFEWTDLATNTVITDSDTLRHHSERIGEFRFKLTVTEDINELHHFKPVNTSINRTYTIIVE